MSQIQPNKLVGMETQAVGSFRGGFEEDLRVVDEFDQLFRVDLDEIRQGGHQGCSHGEVMMMQKKEYDGDGVGDIGQEQGRGEQSSPGWHQR